MKDILAIATGDANDEARLATAALFASHFGAELTVATINEIPDLPLYAADAAAVLPPATTGIQDDFLRHGRQVHARVEQRLESLTSAASVVLLSEFRSTVGDSIARMARLKDLLVVTKPAEPTATNLMGLVLYKVLVEGICGILCLPNETVCSPAVGHATIAWNGSREASRAVQAAMPILEEAERVTVLLIDQPDRRAGDVARAGDDLRARLGHHGINADLVNVTSGEMKTAQAIAAEVDLLKSDLLVMGAQAEGSFRQWFLSGVSRELLSEAKTALLLAH